MHMTDQGRQAMLQQHTGLFRDESTEFPFDINQDSQLLDGGCITSRENLPPVPAISVVPPVSMLPSSGASDYQTEGMFSEEKFIQILAEMEDTVSPPPASNTGGCGSQPVSLYVDYLVFDAVGYVGGFEDSAYVLKSWEKLGELQAAAKGNRSPVLTNIGRHTVEVQPHGFSTNNKSYWWDFVIKFKGVTLALRKQLFMPGSDGELANPDLRAVPNIYVNIPGEPLTIYGIQEILTELESILSVLGFVYLDTGVRRMDVCADIVGEKSIQQMNWSDMVYQQNYSSRVPASNIQNQGLMHSQTGFTVGKRASGCMLRVYDKQAELKAKATDHDPRYASALHERWGASDKPVTRVEFQFGTEFLRDHQDEHGDPLRTVSRCVSSMKTLMVRQLRLKNPFFKLLAEGQDVQQAKRTKNQKRLAIDSDWEFHVETINEASGEVVKLSRERVLKPHVNLQMMARQVSGLADAISNRSGMMNLTTDDRMMVIYHLFEHFSADASKQNRRQQQRLHKLGYEVPAYHGGPAA